MKVKELIEQLRKYNNPDDDIVCAYWSFSDVDDDSLTDDEWQELVRRFDNHSFQQDSDDIQYTLNEIREERCE
jgi:hypothetical protein|tara:strand:+ start:467 stop:685 length:219 start_codon:yes stop_codon:yes gene_type:complete